MPLGIVRTLDILSRKFFYTGTSLRLRRAFARAPLAASADYRWFGTPRIGSKTALIATFGRGAVPETALRMARELEKCGYACNIIAAADVPFEVDCPYPVMVRENMGYDFGSWSHSLSVLDTASCETVLLVNDSIIPGPRFTDLIVELEEADAKTVGVTASKQLRPHVQSYLMMFKGTLNCRHWSRIKSFDRQRAIDFYEIMNSDDFAISGHFPARDAKNPTISHWADFQDYFIKRSLVEGAVDISPLDDPPAYVRH